ncbi:2'-5' RNA ligase family protein [Streptomyces lycii]|uniref:2'-5' RNA ligase family protein n=2 Tax=Streptomyces lycii TaxID=2654337 RepID=A0ABQ7FAZ0_9ACTN|nr:2'-5' RNA ligase family protein [Streptomyces lycii]
MKDHWWWRPGWDVGRRFYTWHLTFDGQTDVHRAAAAYREGLAELPDLTLIPNRWLHLTMQGIGFVNEVDENTIQDIASAAATRLAQVPPAEVELGPAVIHPEAILLPARPEKPIHAVRNAIRAAIGDVLDDVPERAEGFTPHVSVAYNAADRQTEPVAQALAQLDIPPAKAHITSAELIMLHRDNRMYEWTPHTQVPLG